MAAQVGLPSLQVTRYSYRSPGIPMAAQVGLPSLQVIMFGVDAGIIEYIEWCGMAFSRSTGWNVLELKWNGIGRH